jgi:hypothetical protein
MQHVIRFIGKISLEGQANGLPPEIYGFVTMQDADNAAISNAVADQFGRYRNMGGMIVEKNQGSPIDMQVSWLSRMYVPFEWIVNITVAFNNLSHDISLSDESGVERLTDGTEAVKQ